MHDPSTQICSFPSYQFQEWMRTKWWIPKWMTHLTLFTLWHEDPNIRVDDDSCGWFMRSRHGDKAVLEKIVKRFGEDWDRVFNSQKEDSFGKKVGPIQNTYQLGLFCSNGDPNMSVHGIVLNLFFLAAMEHFKVDGRTNLKKARRWMQANLFDILMFAENPTDSMRDSIVGVWGSYDPREDRIRAAASCVYGWILRETRPWYRHPRWHIHHWKFQIHAWQWLRRGLFDRCCYCGKGFKFGSSVISSWSGIKIWHQGCGSEENKPSQPL